MNILLIGSGGREHALAVAITRSPLCTRVLIAPGNAGTAQCGENIALDVTDHAAVIALCRKERIDFVVIGPEAPLVAGLVDDLAAAGIRAFGPSKAAAQLEGSKAFTKALCDEANIPTAAYAAFTDAAAAHAYVEKIGAPIVIKADGLAAGKGVIMAETLAEAREAIGFLFAGGLGAAGSRVVIEEWMVGEEASFFALSDGVTARALASAQDHKRVGDGDTGPNTGGMGAYSPAPVMTPAMEQRVMDEIVTPAIKAMAARGTPFCGVLFAGLMITADGPKLIEFNARFGDPECEALVARLASDILPALIATAQGGLADIAIDWRDEAALTVVMAAKGYPGKPETGTEIRGLGEAAAMPGVQIFHAGTKAEGGRVLANGGRVLAVTALGATVGEAQARAYAALIASIGPAAFAGVTLAGKRSGASGARREFSEA